MSNAKEDVAGRKEPSSNRETSDAGQVASQQSGPSPEELEAAGAEIGDLEICWRSGNTYHVWSENELQTAYLVNLSGEIPTCNCAHGRNNRDGNEACRHIKKAIAVLPSGPQLGDMAIQDLVNVLGDVYELRDSQRRHVTGLEADTAAATGTPAPTGSESTADASDAATRLQDAYDDLIEDMQVQASDGIVWVQTGKDTPDDWPFPGGADTWTVLLKDPEEVQYVGEGGDEYDEHKWFDLKPGEYWKNALEPADVDTYIEAVLG